MREQDKSKTHYFLQTHGHIICYYGSTTSYKGRVTTFSILHLHQNYKLFKTIYQALNKLNQ